jgi:hypothetical protein
MIKSRVLGVSWRSRGRMQHGPARVNYIVKSTDRTGNVCWLSVANVKGIRELGPRWMAATFETEAEARIAIDKMPLTVKASAVVFTVEKAY